MNAAFLRAIAIAVLYVHFAVVLFNVFWLVAVPLGAWRGWAFVRSFGWRAAHLISLAVVALQAVAGSLCFLSIWQSDLLVAAGGPPEEGSVIERFVMRAVFWPLRSVLNRAIRQPLSARRGSSLRRSLRRNWD